MVVGRQQNVRWGSDRRSSRRRVAVCLTLVASAGAPAVSSGGALAVVPTPAVAAPRSREAAGPAFYVVLRLREDGGVTPVLCRRVEMAAVPIGGWGADALDAPDRGPGAERVDIELEGADGRVVLHDRLAIETTRRGEFAAARGVEIDGVRVPAVDPAFVVRVPALGGVRLAVRTGRAAGVQRFDLDDLARREAAAQDLVPAPAHVVWQQGGGDPGNRLDILLMGDGYRDAEADAFSADAAAAADSMLSVSPYSDYRGDVNFTALFTPSDQSGADHPPYDPTCSTTLPICCADPASKLDPLAGQFRDTAFDARFCTANVQRLLTVDDAKVFAAAAAAPDWDRIVVLVNDPTYGGSGGSLAVISRDSAAVFIAQHEFGHSFTGLADEYSSPYPGYPSCSDVSGPGCEPNVTDQTRRELIKWTAWIDPSTPLPTPDGGDSSTVGLFEGARYKPTGMYRPEHECAMRSFAPFCAVCRQAYVLRLYDGGWGVPSAGIDLIDPGSESPRVGTLSVPRFSTTVFSVALLGPSGGPPPQVVWRVDDEPVPGATTPAFAFKPSRAGTFTVEVEATDVTSLVNPALRTSRMVSRRTWTVTVTPRTPRRQRSSD